MKTKIRFIALICAVLCIVAMLMPHKISAIESLSAGSGEIRETIEISKVSNIKQLQAALEDENITGNIEITETIKIEEDIIINGKNKTITTSKAKAFEVHTGTVEFKNLTIINSATNGRCIDVRDGDVALTLDNVSLKATAKSHNQPLTIGSTFSQTIPVNIKNTTIEAGPDGWGYAAIIFNPVNMKIENSNITGYSAIYMKSEKNGGTGTTGSTIAVNNSTLTGKYELATNEPSNSFATIVFEDSGINVDIKNSKLYAKGAIQKVIGEYSGMEITNKHNKVSVSGNSVISTQQRIASMKDPNASVILNVGVKSNIEIPVELLPKGASTKLENGQYVVYIPQKEVDYIIPENKTETDKDFSIGIIETEKVKDILNSSLKENVQLNQKIDEATKNGETVKVEIKMEALEKRNVKEEEKQKILQTIKANQIIHQYFDISVLVSSDQIELGKITQLSEKMKFSIEISENLIQKGRKFYIIKLHGDEAERIETVLNGTKLEFETDQFSTFALVYEDEVDEKVEVPIEKDDTPKTGGIYIPSYVCFVATAIVVILVRKNNHIENKK